MPYIVTAQKLAFQRTKPDDPTVPVGAEDIVTRGNFVPDYAPEFLVSTLSNSGLVVWAEERLPAVVPATDVPAQVRTPDQPPVLPSDPNGVVPVLADRETPEPVVVDVTPVDENPEAPEQLPALPKDADKKDAWEAYAARPQIGMTLAEAESMNKTDLVAEVKRRHAAATA